MRNPLGLFFISNYIMKKSLDIAFLFSYGIHVVANNLILWSWEKVGGCGCIPIQINDVCKIVQLAFLLWWLHVTTLKWINCSFSQKKEKRKRTLSNLVPSFVYRRPSAIPGPVPDEIVLPVANSIGMFCLFSSVFVQYLCT